MLSAHEFMGQWFQEGIQDNQKYNPSLHYQTNHQNSDKFTLDVMDKNAGQCICNVKMQWWISILNLNLNGMIVWVIKINILIYWFSMLCAWNEKFIKRYQNSMHYFCLLDTHAILSLKFCPVLVWELHILCFFVIFIWVWMHLILLRLFPFLSFWLY